MGLVHPNPGVDCVGGNCSGLDVGILDGGYTKTGPLPELNSIDRVMPSCILLAKLDRAVCVRTHIMCCILQYT